MLKQSLHHKLLQKLSPQQIQLMKLIQLPTQAFEERIKQEVEENPALDTGKEQEENFEDTLANQEYEDDGNEKIEAEDINIDEYLSDDEFPSYKTQANNYSADDDEKSIPYAAGTTFHQSLLNQLNTFRIDEEEKLIAEFLVGSIDESGYIRRELIDLVDDLAFTQNVFTEEAKVEKILKNVIHNHTAVILTLVGVFILEIIFGFYARSIYADNPEPLFYKGQSIKDVGMVLYTDYVLYFQLSGIVLLLAMVGAIALTLRTREGVKRQDPMTQIFRDSQDAVENIKIKPNAGLED